MSYIGGSQFSVDNRTDNNLSSYIQRADDAEKIKANIMPMLYTGRVQANSSANYARNYYGQLCNTGVNNRDISLLQYNGFKDDVINASSREMQSASRFNYAFDRQINKRYIDVSGQFIPNNKLRVLPNRSCVMYGTQPPAYTDPNLKLLSDTLMTDVINLSYDPSGANSYLKYKANRPKLTRQDLMSAAQQYATRPAQVVVGTGQPTYTAQSLGLSARTTEIIEGVRRRRNLNVELPVSV
jgi:hypothetical protein